MPRLRAFIECVLPGNHENNYCCGLGVCSFFESLTTRPVVSIGTDLFTLGARPSLAQIECLDFSILFRWWCLSMG